MTYNEIPVPELDVKLISAVLKVRAAYRAYIKIISSKAIENGQLMYIIVPYQTTLNGKTHIVRTTYNFEKLCFLTFKAAKSFIQKYKAELDIIGEFI